MTTATRSPTSESYDSECDRHGPCPDCRPGHLDSFRCAAEGVKARAEYDAAHAAGPTPAQYDAARVSYGAARNAAGPVVHEVGQQLEQVTEQIRCIINDPDVVERLEHAWRLVRRRLRKCGVPQGCCVDEECGGEFDTDVSGQGVEVIQARIAQYEHRTAAAEKCFADLAGEPERLTARVEAAKSEVAALVAAVGGDTTKTDFKRLYADALVADWHLDRIWWGFDHAHDYVDCICQALQCSLEGRAALSVLTGELAVRMCMRKSHDDRCAHLRENVAAAVIEEYVRCRQPRHPHDEHEDDEERAEEHDDRRPEDDHGYDDLDRGYDDRDRGYDDRGDERPAGRGRPNGEDRPRAARDRDRTRDHEGERRRNRAR